MTDPEAPYGRKKDGTPRKRKGRAPGTRVGPLTKSGQPTRKTGPKPWVPTEQQRHDVAVMALVGTPVEMIANIIGKSATLISKTFPIELANGKARCIAVAAKTLFQGVVEGDRVSAMFFLKTQAGWRETTKVEHGGRLEHINIGDFTDIQLDELIARLEFRQGETDDARSASETAH